MLDVRRLHLPVCFASIDPSFLTDIPPILQLCVAGFVGVFAILSLIARLNPGLRRRVFSHDDRSSIDHWTSYTLIPTIVFLGMAAVVVLGWDSQRPLFGEAAWWNGRGPIIVATVLGTVPSVVLFASIWPLSRRADADSPGAPFKSTAGCLAALCFIAAVVLLPLGIIVSIAVARSLRGS